MNGQRDDPRVGAGARLGAGVIGAACLAILVVAARLTPSPSGYGTHLQIGLPGMGPCPWAEKYGKPCATCGMTTAFAHAADGDVISAFRVQPAGALAALGLAVAFWGCLHVTATGSRVGVMLARLWRPRTLVAVVLVVLAAWGVTWLRWPERG